MFVSSRKVGNLGIKNGTVRVFGARNKRVYDETKGEWVRWDGGMGSYMQESRAFRPKDVGPLDCHPSPDLVRVVSAVIRRLPVKPWFP